MQAKAHIAAVVLLSWALAAPAQQTEPDAITRLSRILDLIKSRYVEPVDDARLFNSAVSGIMKSLDLNSAYLDPEAYRRLLQEAQGRYGGLGIEVRKDGAYLRIVTVFEDSPAQRAGLLPGDRISAANEQSFAAMTLEQAVRHVRGEPQTTLLLTLHRDDEPGARRLALDREQIQGRSVRAGLIGEYIYVRLTEFHRHTADEMTLRIERLVESSPVAVQGVVLDLRDNPGGTLNSAVALASAFLPPNELVVYTHGMSQEANLKFLSRHEDYLRGQSEDYLERLPPIVRRAPLMVLVNRGSASSSEIVAAALQDHERATIIGTRTYGKGSIQVILPLGDGSAIKLTTSRYYSPKGHIIEKNGVQPHHLVDQDPVEGTDAVSHVVASGRLESYGDMGGSGSRVACGVDADATEVDSRNRSLNDVSSDKSKVFDCQLATALRLLDQRNIARRY